MIHADTHEYTIVIRWSPAAPLCIFLGRAACGPRGMEDESILRLYPEKTKHLRRFKFSRQMPSHLRRKYMLLAEDQGRCGVRTPLMAWWRRSQWSPSAR